MSYRTAWILSALTTTGVAVAVLILSKGNPEGLLIAFVVLAVEAGMYWLIFRPLLHAQALLQQGELAQAMVLEVWDTGTTINENPQLGLRLEVRPTGDVPFQVESKSVVSRLLLGDIRPGAMVQVRYDPQDQRRVVVVPSAQVQPASRGPAARLKELEELRERGLVTQDEYERKREDILGAL